MGKNYWEFPISAETPTVPSATPTVSSATPFLDRQSRGLCHSSIWTFAKIRKFNRVHYHFPESTWYWTRDFITAAWKTVPLLKWERIASCLNWRGSTRQSTTLNLVRKNFISVKSLLVLRPTSFRNNTTLTIYLVFGLQYICAWVGPS